MKKINLMIMMFLLGIGGLQAQWSNAPVPQTNGPPGGPLIMNTQQLTTTSSDGVQVDLDVDGGNIFLHNDKAIVFGRLTNGEGEYIINGISQVPSGHALSFFSGYVERMRIQNNGNVGIGILTPTTQFHTNGGVRFEGTQQNTTTANRVMVQDNAGNVFWRNGNFGALTFADQGLTVVGGNTAVLGSKCGSDLGQFQRNREVNMNNLNLYFDSGSLETPEEANGNIYMGETFQHPCKQLEARLEISSAWQTNSPVNDYLTPNPSTSGLRFTDLTMNSTPVENLSKGVLSLDEDGDVIWVLRDLGIPPFTTNVLSSAGNTMTSNVNGVVSSASIINNNALTLVGNNLTSIVNGVASNVVTLPSGVNSTCVTQNLLPKVGTGGSTDLICSQVYDDGIGVGIGTTGPFGIFLTSIPPFTGGNVPINVAANLRLDVNGIARFTGLYATSDRTLKTNISKVSNANSLITQLHGKTYQWTEEYRNETNVDNGLHYGFIAQEVEEVMPEAVIKDENGRYAVEYNAFIPVLVESQKELIKENEYLKSEINDLKSDIASLMQLITKEKQSDETTETAKAKLYQNFPNPFAQKTLIKYFVPECRGACEVLVYTLSGVEVYRHTIGEKGEGEFEFDVSSLLPNQYYVYSLFENGKLVDSMKMLTSDMD